MKKFILLLLITIVAGGCNIKELKNVPVEQVIDNIMKADIKLYNRVGIGYKYYLPVGVLVESSNDYNEVLYANNEIYYVFIDIVSYYNKEDIEIEEVKGAFYYDTFVYRDKKAYIQILEDDNEYYVKAIYNYAKIETYVDKKNLKESLYYIFNILSSINYHDSIIKEMVEKQKELDSKEIKIEDYTPKKSKTTFLEYIEKYDDYEKKDEIDDMDIDTIKPNDIN